MSKSRDSVTIFMPENYMETKLSKEQLDFQWSLSLQLLALPQDAREKILIFTIIEVMKPAQKAIRTPETR